jgi:uncharacterized membrane protein
LYNVPLALGVAAAVALASVVSLIQPVTSEVGLQLVLRNLGPQRSVVVRQTNATATTYRDFQADAQTRVKRAVSPGAVSSRSSVLAGDAMLPRTLNGFNLQTIEPSEPHPNLIVYDGLEKHVEIVQGQLPGDGTGDQNTWPAAVSEIAADNLSLKLNDLYCVLAGTPTRSVSNTLRCLRITAVWRPRDKAEPYWGLSFPTGGMSVTSATFFDFLKKSPTLGNQFWLVFDPDPATIHQNRAQSISQQLNELRGFYTYQRSDTLFRTGLDEGINAFFLRVQVAQFTVQLMAALLLVISLYFLVFASGHVLDQQRQLFAVWRSRGWSRLQTWVVLMLEFGILALAAIPIGLISAWFAVDAVSRTVFGDQAPARAGIDLAELWQPAASAALLGLTVLGLQAVQTSRKGLLDVRRRASRPEMRAWWQWRYLDLAMVVVALLLLAQTQLRGSSQVRTAAGQSASDPLSLLTPALALTVITLAALRLLPLAARLSRAVRRDVSGSLALWQLARQPIQHSRLALLVALTVAVGLFASIYSTTERLNTVDRIAYAAGADFRLHLDGAAPPLDQATAELKGVRASSQVYRGPGQPGNTYRDATILGVDPYSFQQVTWWRPDLTREPLGPMLERLATQEQGAYELPGQPRKLGLWVFGSGIQGELSAGVVDSRGVPCACSLGGIDFQGWRYLETEIRLATTTIRYPLRLRQLALRPTGKALIGDFAMSSLTVGDSTGNTTVIEDFVEGKEWWRIGEGRSRSNLDSSLLHSREGRKTVGFELSLATGRLSLRPPPTENDLVPALAPAATLQRLGVKVNQSILMKFGSQAVRLLVVGVADHFPTLYPEESDFFVVDRDPMLSHIGFFGNPVSWPNEVWINVDPRFRQEDADRIRARRDLLELSDRHYQETLALRDPLLLGLQSNLVIGFVAALSLAVVGFGLHFWLATQGRHSEYAILQANGLSSTQIQRSLSIEQWILLGFSVAIGIGLGLFLSWSVLPTLQLGTRLYETVPATVVMVDPPVAAGAVALVSVFGLAVGSLASRASRRFRLIDELRMLA